MVEEREREENFIEIKRKEERRKRVQYFELWRLERLNS